MKRLMTLGVVLCSIIAVQLLTERAQADDTWMYTLRATTTAAGCTAQLRQHITYSVQCDQATYVATHKDGFDGGTAATNLNVYIDAQKLYDVVVNSDAKYICVLGATATTTCQVYQLRLKGQ